jgi:hypothetical protein
MVTARPSLAGYFLTGLNPDSRTAQRPIGMSLSIETVLRGAPEPSPVTANSITV